MNTNSPTCLITGGSSGIGLATAKRFASEGFHVGICGRRADALRLAKQEILADHGDIEFLTFVADLTDIQDAKNFAQHAITHFGRVDVLVNNAAAAPLGPFETLTAEEFETSVNINIRSLFYLTQIIWNHQKQLAIADVDDNIEPAFHPNIISVSSMAAVDPFPGFSLYGASKSWLELLTHALANEGKELGLRVCAIRPGAVETPLLRSLFPGFPADQCVSPETVAEKIWSCVADPENYPSGQAFEVTA